MASLRSRIKTLLLLVAGSTLLYCVGPKQEPVYKNDRGTALGTTYNIIYEVPNDSVDFREAILAVFDSVNASMSTYWPDSDISRINQGDTTVQVDAYFKEVFLKSKEVWQTTHGVFDPTVGALVNAWGFGPGKSLAALDSAKVDSILVFTGMEKVSLKGGNRIIKAHPDLFLDFNALAKGYCIDLVGRMLDRNGVENYLVEIGGEVLSKGRNTSKVKNWVVAIDSPVQSDQDRVLIARIKLEDRAMATSGNYRKFRIDEKTGEKYVHTIDPRTGYPFKNKVLSASVLSSTCMEADAYATAFMLMSLDSIQATLKAVPGLEAYIISFDDNGAISEYRSPGFEELVLE